MAERRTLCTLVESRRHSKVPRYHGNERLDRIMDLGGVVSLNCNRLTKKVGFTRTKITTIYKERLTPIKIQTVRDVFMPIEKRINHCFDHLYSR